MSDKKHNIFRQEALQRLSSSERLDQMMQVVNPQDWLPLGTLAVFVVLGLLWSVFGNIPITVTGKGVFINPRQVMQFQSPISGQLQSLKVREGQCVNKGEIIATINPSDKKQQLQQQRQKLAQLKQQRRQTTLLRQQRTQLETEAMIAERIGLQQRLQATQMLNPRLKDQGIDAIVQQRRSLQQRLQDAQELVPILEQRLGKQQELQKQGAISQEQVLQAEKEYRQTRQNIFEINAQLQQLRVQETELQQKYLENLNNISQTNAQLEKLATVSKQLEQNNLEIANTEKNQIQEVEQAIARLEKEVADNSTIQSAHTGCIVELTATVGQYVNPGTRLGSFQIVGKADEAVSVTYFSVADGKQIRPGMQILITPDTVKRTRFGGIVGKITSISPFSVTAEGAASVVGNPEVVQQLIGREGGKIEVIAQLEIDPETFSGYRWSSSRGPQMEISPGTTTTTQVTVEKRSPITFVLPILREWSGINW